MNRSSRICKDAKRIRSFRVVLFAVLLISPAILVSNAQDESGKLTLISDGKVVSDKVAAVDAEQGFILSLQDKGAPVEILNIHQVTLEPKDDFFVVEAVSGKPDQIKLTPKAKFTAQEIAKRFRVMYTSNSGVAISSTKVAVTINANVKVVVTVSTKEIPHGGTFLITEGTKQNYTVAITRLSGDESLPDATLSSKSKNVIVSKEASDLTAASLEVNGDGSASIVATSGNDEVSGFDITATVLQKAQLVELDKAVSSLDEGTSVTVQARLKSKAGTPLSINESRKIVAEVDESSRNFVTVDDLGDSKFKITAKLINFDVQSNPSPQTAKEDASASAAVKAEASKTGASKTGNPKTGETKINTASTGDASKTRGAAKSGGAAKSTGAAKSGGTARSGGTAESSVAAKTGAASTNGDTAGTGGPAAGSAQSATNTAKNVRIAFKIVQEGVAPGTGLDLSFFIQPTFGYITFTPPPVAFLLPNGTITTVAQVRGQQGQPLPNPVSFKPEDENEAKKWVVISQEGNQLNVYWNEPADSELKKVNGTAERRPPQIVVLANSFVGEHKIQSKVFIRMGEVAKFAPLKIKLNIMDQRTARDLYGGVTSDEYYVLTVRLFNNLKDEDSKQYLGSSILAYSASVEVAVGLEKKFNSKLKSDQTGVISKEQSEALKSKREQGLSKLSTDQIDADRTVIGDFQKQINDAVKEQREAEKEAAKRESLYLEVKLKSESDKSSKSSKEVDEARKAAESARAVADVKLDQLIGLQSQIAKSAEARAYALKQLVDYADLGLTVDDGKWHTLRRGDLYQIAPTIKSYPPQDRRVISDVKPDDEPVCTGVVKYRPFSFEMMVNTVDRRDERGLRSRVFLLLNGLGTATSFFTAVLQPPNSNSTRLVLEKYSNLLLPALDKLFPSLKEQQRQNIVSQAMKTIEEIPFGSDITRVLFIPKKTIRGLLSGHDVRISEVCPFYFSIEVAIVKKGGVVQQGSANP